MRKYLLASLDQSLKRMGLEYVDIFYSHRPDPNTPLEETMSALDQAVRQGKALYAAISSYSKEQTRQAAKILRELGTPCLIHQPSYSMFNRRVEDGLLDTLQEEGGLHALPLAQGLLTDTRHPGGRASVVGSEAERCQRTGGANSQIDLPKRGKRWRRDVGAAPPGDDLCPDRRKQRQAGGRQRRCTQQLDLYTRRTEGN
jgi:aryl-alcohol dehydrogenase-like predicted oxidoreductase